MTNLQKKPFLVFLAGVHGVGKSTLCRTTFGLTGFHCVSASSIIKSRAGEVYSDKSVGAIDDNQRKLIEGVDSLRLQYARLVIDGHFALLNKERQVERIAAPVFRAIRPDLMILLYDDPSEIAMRLSHRDGRKWESELIEWMQNEERVHAELVAADLNVRLEAISFANASVEIDQLLQKIAPP